MNCRLPVTFLLSGAFDSSGLKLDVLADKLYNGASLIYRGTDLRQATYLVSTWVRRLYILSTRRFTKLSLSPSFPGVLNALVSTSLFLFAEL